MNATIRVEEPSPISFATPVTLPALVEAAATRLAWARACRRLDQVEALDSDAPGILENLQRSLEDVLSALPATGGRVLVRDPHDQQLLPVCGNLGRHWTRLDASTELAEWVVEHARSAVVNDARSDGRSARSLQRSRRLLAVPLTIQERVWGVVEIQERSDECLFTVYDQRQLERYAQAAARVLALFLVRAGIDPAANPGYEKRGPVRS